MNKTLGTILLILTMVILAGGIFFAGTLYARSNMMFGWNNNSGYGPGLMGQGGMMSGNGGMMNRYAYTNRNLTTLTIEQAKAAAEKYLSGLDTSDLAVGEIMVFDNHAYVIIKETATGLGAFELLVDPVSQIAYPEHGPNMMWNLKYGGLNHQFMLENNGGMMGGAGMMNGMMGGNAWTNITPVDLLAEMTVTPEDAVEYAEDYLDENIPGATATAPIQFYGYYTLDFEKDGKISGMLSVNGYSGQVFLHTWHGVFVEEAEE
jgi:hypothetical protein